MWEYSDKVKDHFFNPRNVGEIENPDGVGEVGSMACGDALKFAFKLDEKGRISEAKFKTFGCGSAIATASILTEMVIGKTLEEAKKITNQDIADSLGGLPAAKMHCSVMGREALDAAIGNYFEQAAGKPVEEEGKIVCRCFGVTDKKIERVIRENNLRTVAQVTHYTKAGGGCGSCHPEIARIIERVWGSRRDEQSEPSEPKLSSYQKAMKINEIIKGEIRPRLLHEGGDVEVVDISGDEVRVAFRGKCVGCLSMGLTIKFIEKKLREFISDDIRVVGAK